MSGGNVAGMFQGRLKSLVPARYNDLAEELHNRDAEKPHDALSL